MMEALILVALVVVAALILGLVMYRLAVATARWWNAVTFALLAIGFGAMLFDALRRRRSAGS